MIKLYEENAQKLNDRHKLDRMEELEVKEEMNDLRRHLARELKYMINHVELKENEMRKLRVKNKDKEASKLKDELKYKQLESLNCQKSYALICGSSVSQPTKAVTLEELKKKQEIREPLFRS